MTDVNPETEPTWEELCAMKSGTILYDKEENGHRFIVMRGENALCAYVGVPLTHSLAGKGLSLNSHGGTYLSKEGDGCRPKGWWWWGWDYAHDCDRNFYMDKQSAFWGDGYECEEWGVRAVIVDSERTIRDLERHMGLREGDEDGDTA